MNSPSLRPLRGPLTPAKARNAALINQLATPGLGSLLARRWFAGTGQLLLAIAGFVMVVGWFVMLMIELYQETLNSGSPRSIGWLGEAGALCFAVSWVWSLFTSLSLLREGKQNLPPPIPPN